MLAVMLPQYGVPDYFGCRDYNRKRLAISTVLARADILPTIFGLLRRASISVELPSPKRRCMYQQVAIEVVKFYSALDKETAFCVMPVRTARLRMVTCILALWAVFCPKT